MGMTKKYHDEDTYTDVMQYVCSSYKVPNGLIGGFGVDPYQAIEQFTRTAQIYGKPMEFIFGTRSCRSSRRNV